MEFYAIIVHNMSLQKMWGDLTFDEAKKLLFAVIESQDAQHYINNKEDIDACFEDEMEYYLQQDSDNEYLFAIGACE